MTAQDKIEQKLEQLAQAIDSQDSIVQSVMSRIEAKPRKSENQKNIPMIRRIIMNRFTKFAAAAVIVIGVILGASIIDMATPYALSQTISANHGVRYIYIKDFKPGESDPKEIWIEFFEEGDVKTARLNFPAWASADGEKVVVWKDNKAQVWFKKKNSVATIKDKEVAEHLLSSMQEFSPLVAVERLMEWQALGKVSVEIDEPSDKSKPIVVTATNPPDGSKQGQRRILLVDRKTKLVTAIESYKLKDGEYQKSGVTEYHGYNQPIDPAVFNIEDKVPADAMRIDQTTQEIGLAQGQLSDEEIAVEVVRQFIEALIAADYAEAGRLFAGLSPEFLEKKLAGVKYLRIVSIGRPKPAMFNNSLKVPCKYEAEARGAKSIVESGIYVRPVHGQPGRWSIDGGF